jgi:aspartyl-tRNA(Asn)/glutamyl-tRNA(Gln) amidotransferase subunit A
MTFADWQTLAPEAAARLVHERAAALPPAQQRAALAWLAPEPRLAAELSGRGTGILPAGSSSAPLAGSDSDSSLPAPRSPLKGIPFAAKDLFDAAGLPTFAGSNFLPEVRHAASAGLAPADGAFIRDVHAAGAALAAKAHMHEFAYGITGENPHYGDCEVPGHPGRTTGGSSSGSALLVKAGVVPFALGTDTGGSIRVPAAFCGLHGFRMTPRHPWISDGVLLAESLDTPGFFTANASDLRALLDALVPERGMGAPPMSGSPLPAPRSSLKGAWLALPGLDPAVEKAFRAAAARLAEPIPVSTAAELLPLFAPAAELYAILGGIETWRLHAPFYDRYRDRYDPNVRMRIDRARTLTAADGARAQANRDAITAAWASLFREYDYIVLPASPCPAITKPECTVEMRSRILSLTVPASMASLPVLALPVPLPDTGGLSTGLQVVVPSIHSPAIRHALALHG